MPRRIRVLAEFAEGEVETKFYCPACEVELVVTPKAPSFCPECRATLDVTKLTKYNPSAKRSNK